MLSWVPIRSIRQPPQTGRVCNAEEKRAHVTIYQRLNSLLTNAVTPIEELPMKPLPQTEETLLLRTDFSNEAVWREICSAVRTPGPELQEALGFFAAVVVA